MAVYRIIARKNGYYPDDVEQCLEHDWICDNYNDVFVKIAPAVFFEKDPVEAKKKQDTLFNEILPQFFTRHVKFFTNPGKFLFGDKILMADFLVGKIYVDYFANPKCPCKDRWDGLISKFPYFETYGKRFAAEMANYLAKRPESAI